MTVESTALASYTMEICLIFLHCLGLSGEVSSHSAYCVFALYTGLMYLDQECAGHLGLGCWNLLRTFETWAGMDVSQHVYLMYSHFNVIPQYKVPPPIRSDFIFA
jgi:hypothetical protein